MICEKLLQAVIQYQLQQGERPNILRINQGCYRTILEQLAYPDWLIENKINNLDQTFLRIQVELTNEIEMFEVRKIKKVAES
ncbi:hypothetical protein [Bacillus thuringiensis]|uniref:Uncharacterized protein n=1 Tax=Bacillus thuringiensis TaxID=1428 RepID=A0A9X6Y9E2_BACTU|nr:hypothetical protein [Bacillus thuringiensis]PEA88308.1 hypothetical protein CON71_19715 [Bacillus thuringiensis]